MSWQLLSRSKDASDSGSRRFSTVVLSFSPFLCTPLQTETPRRINAVCCHSGRIKTLLSKTKAPEERPPRGHRAPVSGVVISGRFINWNGECGGWARRLKGKVRRLNKIASMDSFDGLLLRIALDLRCVILESLQVDFTESTLLGYWQVSERLRWVNGQRRGWDINAYTIR
ncbi:hypothetical protein PISMIDRAFT_256094 [Pisolithus microcarpus 441]|uniref:Unplaced genomic scaffold scaffold_167, whole genome shotgun sequence n=1 Tax=Pisolithus microcarpus 441 TaxID=765257 RepID=A0A0C9YIY5_9AGAM|nr:hypothetical protein PISMIDRAFT_256094 [Pisolithus microcarpus 441]